MINVFLVLIHHALERKRVGTREEKEFTSDSSHDRRDEREKDVKIDRGRGQTL